MKVKLTFVNGETRVIEVADDTQKALSAALEELLEREPDLPGDDFIDSDYLDDWFPEPVEGIDY